MENSSKLKLIVACSGSVAALKLSELVDIITKTNKFDIKIVVTNSSKHFIKDQLSDLKSKHQVIQDQQEWFWNKRGDTVLHIQLRRWADLMLIAPLSANTLAKIANGLCDNTLTLIIRCWDFKSKNQDGTLKKPVLVCPAMNTLMYQNPITSKQLKMIREELGIQIVDPIEKILVCQQKGIGAMASVPDIMSILLKLSQKIENSDNISQS